MGGLQDTGLDMCLTSVLIPVARTLSHGFMTRKDGEDGLTMRMHTHTHTQYVRMHTHSKWGLAIPFCISKNSSTGQRR